MLGRDRARAVRARNRRAGGGRDRRHRAAGGLLRPLYCLFRVCRPAGRKSGPRRPDAGGGVPPRDRASRPPGRSLDRARAHRCARRGRRGRARRPPSSVDRVARALAASLRACAHARDVPPNRRRARRRGEAGRGRVPKAEPTATNARPRDAAPPGGSGRGRYVGAQARAARRSRHRAKRGPGARAIGAHPCSSLDDERGHCRGRARGPPSGRGSGPGSTRTPKAGVCTST